MCGNLQVLGCVIWLVWFFVAPASSVGALWVGINGWPCVVDHASLLRDIVFFLGMLFILFILFSILYFSVLCAVCSVKTVCGTQNTCKCLYVRFLGFGLKWFVYYTSLLTEGVLCTVYCILCTVYCVLCTVYCVLCTVYCVLCTVYCVLCTVYCVLCTVYCVLCTVYCVLCTALRICFPWSEAPYR